MLGFEAKCSAGRFYEEQLHFTHGEGEMPRFQAQLFKDGANDSTNWFNILKDGSGDSTQDTIVKQRTSPNSVPHDIAMGTTSSTTGYSLIVEDGTYVPSRE